MEIKLRDVNLKIMSEKFLNLHYFYFDLFSHVFILVRTINMDATVVKFDINIGFVHEC